jgi:hypothetical protein
LQLKEKRIYYIVEKRAQEKSTNNITKGTKSTNNITKGTKSTNNITKGTIHE